MASPVERFRFSVAEYDRMIEERIFPPETRIELLDGEVVNLPPIGPRHAYVVRQLRHAFLGLDVDDRAVVDTQNPAHVVTHEPHPDLMLLRPRADNYRSLPNAEDVLLLVEVADTAVDRDRWKATIYASASIPEYWIIDVSTGPTTITVYRDPQPDGYHSRQILRAGDPLAPLAFPDLAIDTGSLLE